MSDSYSTTNLMINNIPSAISDDLLNKLFTKFGSIKSCKIIRISEKDDKTFGFCEYNDTKSASTALLHLDGYKLNDRTLKVSYAKLFPKPKGKCIEVTNLPKSTQEESVRKYFSQFGRISRLRLLNIDSNSGSSKTAEIVFDNKYEAEKASQKSSIKWNYDSCKQVNVSVNLSASERSYTERDYRDIQSHSAAPIGYSNINSQTQLGDNYFYIQQRSQTAFTQNPFDFSNLSGLVSCGSLGSIYHNAMQISPLNSGFFPNQTYAGMSMPFGTYQSDDKSLHTHNPFNGLATMPYNFLYPPSYYGTFVNNNSLSVGIPLMYTHPCKTTVAIDCSTVNDKQPPQLTSLHQPRLPSMLPKTDWHNKTTSKNAWVVYVYNIGNATNGEQLRELFSDKYDKDILRVDVPKDLQNGSNKNFGFITFKNFSVAQLAIDEMNGKEFQGKSLQVSFKK